MFEKKKKKAVKVPSWMPPMIDKNPLHKPWSALLEGKMHSLYFLKPEFTTAIQQDQ